VTLDMWWEFLRGAWVCLFICGGAILIGIPLGAVIALLRAARIPVLNQVLMLYVSVVRATPLLSLVLFIFLSSQGFGIRMRPDVAAITALVVNTAAFNAEIWRGAFLAFPREQKEAALAIGMTAGVFFRRIQLPQTITASLPGLINEASFVIKASPAIAVIGVVEITQVARRMTATTFDPLTPLAVTALFYIVVIGLLTRLQSRLERNAERLTA